jgi:hypothetical protein
MPARTHSRARTRATAVRNHRQVVHRPVKRAFLAVARTGEELPPRRLPGLPARVAALQASHEQRVESEINSPHRAQRGTDPPVPAAGEETDDERDWAQCSGDDPDSEEAPVSPWRVSVPWSSHALDCRTAGGEDRTPLVGRATNRRPECLSAVLGGVAEGYRSLRFVAPARPGTQPMGSPPPGPGGSARRAHREPYRSGSEVRRDEAASS